VASDLSPPDNITQTHLKKIPFSKKRIRGRHRDVLKIHIEFPATVEVMKKRYFLTDNILSVHEISVSPKIFPKCSSTELKVTEREERRVFL
jgi:hypothetical protein